MPLSPPAPREHLHTRTVTCTGHRREDGLWDIEGHLVDTKTYGFGNHDRGRIEAGEPIHQMWLRLTVDDALTIVAVEAVTDHGPYAMCPAITPNFQRLVGLQIKGGFTHAVRERLGGIEGCTHLVELTGPVATTAFQTVYPYLQRLKDDARRAAADSGEPEPPPRGARRRPALLGTCHAFAPSSPVVKRIWPDWHEPAEG
jgi:hypothetical protein